MMRTVYVIEKRIYVKGDDIEPGSLASWVFDLVIGKKRNADRYCAKFNDNPNSLQRRHTKRWVN